MPEVQLQHKEIPLTGKMTTAEPAAIGLNFRTLKNLRYTDTHLRGVAGMTKINTSPLTTYLKTRSAFHFKKSQPPESHVLVQSLNTAGTASQVLQNTTAIPAQGAFSASELLADATGSGRGYFSDAPDGQVVYCNGVDTCLWGGNELWLGALITSSAAITDGGIPTSPVDYTDIINNTKTDSSNVVNIGGGSDSYTVLLLHGNGVDGSTTITDSSIGGGGSPPKTITVAGGAQIDTAYSKFGGSSILISGAPDYIYVASTDPDIHDFNMGTGNFTIDFWVRLNSTSSDSGLFEQYLTHDDKVSFWVETGGWIHFGIVSASSKIIGIDPSTQLVEKTWNHIALIRNGNNWYIAINGIIGSPTVASITYPVIDTGFYIGKSYNYTPGSETVYFLNGWLDEFRVSKGIARWTTNFTVPVSEYREYSRTWLVGANRPIQGLKYYVSNGNGTASTMTGKVWNGTTWQTLALTDNTDTGASLAVTGTVTFASTVGIAKPLYLEGYFLYWYQFSIDAGSAIINHITVDAPFQSILDMWDGVFRDVMRFFQYTTSYLDNTINVLSDDYEASADYTYYAIGDLAAFSTPNNCLEIGFQEKQTGFRIGVSVPNTTAATVMAVDYWDGTEYVTVGTVTDGTSSSSISLTQTGVVSWNNSSSVNEAAKVVSNSPVLYYYRIRFDKAISSGARINYVGGITAQNEISHYKFPLFAQGRVLLCCDMAGEKNRALASSKYMPQVYNGYDAINIYFGEEGELTCGTELFSQFGSSLYSLILMFKDYETWVVAGTDITAWENNTFLLSSSIGCPAPLTLKTVNLAAEPGAGINRALAIWQGAAGVYMSDGRAPIPIHGDIKEYFDPTDSRYINPSIIGDSVAFVDTVNQEYHLLLASGTELVYDIHRNRWFEIDRSSDLQCGVIVHDTDGNAYNYGFLDTGYMERLEYGKTFDGADITHTFHFGDIALAGLSDETRLSDLRLLTVAKTTTSNNITCTHTSDSGTVVAAVNATGTISMSGVATAGEKFIIDDKTFTWVATRTGTGEVTIGASATAAASNIVTAITADMTTVTAVAGTPNTTVVVTAVTAGVLGNSIVFTESSTNMTMNGGGVLGGTLAGADSTATSFTMSPARSGYRLAIPEIKDKLNGDPFHSLKFDMTTSDETIGFEPLAIVATFHKIDRKNR